MTLLSSFGCQALPLRGVLVIRDATVIGDGADFLQAAAAAAVAGGSRLRGAIRARQESVAIAVRLQVWDGRRPKLRTASGTAIKGARWSSHPDCWLSRISPPDRCLSSPAVPNASKLPSGPSHFTPPSGTAVASDAAAARVTFDETVAFGVNRRGGCIRPVHGHAEVEFRCRAVLRRWWRSSGGSGLRMRRGKTADECGDAVAEGTTAMA
jgi:hypothetical protein